MDGNGRTTHLLMNIVQCQLGLILSIVSKENKEAYIQALIDSCEAENVGTAIIFGMLICWNDWLLSFLIIWVTVLVQKT